MNKIISVNLDVNVDELIYNLSFLSQEDAIKYITKLEKYYADWDMTEQLARHFIEEMTLLFKYGDYSAEQPEDKKAWINYLKSQIKEMEDGI